MNTFKKLLVVIMVLILLMMPVCYAKDNYSIPVVSKDITVLEDGATKIDENIMYNIKGSANGVYRDIPRDEEQTLTNISVETPGYYNTLEVIEEENNTKIKVWLYKDEAKTIKVSDEKVKVIYHYNFNKGVKIYNDIAELQYTSWGEEWESGVEQLKTNIHILSIDNETVVWNNPSDYVTDSYWTDDNTLHTTVTGLKGHTSFEQRIILPKSSFKNYTNAKVINMDAKEKIHDIQEKYNRQRNFQNEFSFTSIILEITLMILPLGAYLLFGRELENDYNKKYEYDIPTKSTPLEVNILAKEDIGVPDQSAIYATLLDLIDRRYYKVISSNTEDTILKYNNKDITGLKLYEQQLMEHLAKYNVDGKISLKKMGGGVVKTYHKFEDKWIETAKKEVPESKIKEYFTDTGSKLFSIIYKAQLIIALGIMVLLWICHIETKISDMVFYASCILLVESVILFMLPNSIAGRWTKKGRTYHEQWKSFMNYLTEYSLIKERPPESVQVWGRYLIYAAAMGKAEEVNYMMNQYFHELGINDSELYANDLIFLAHSGGVYNMINSFTSVNSPSSSSGIGNAGSGGFGGGGGGTF